MKFLLHHDYVGNIREMKNLIERMVILSADSGVLSMAGESWMPDQSEESAAADGKVSVSVSAEEHRCFEEVSYKEAKANFDREFILSMLRTTNGNITKAAEKMDMSRRQLFNKIVELQIDVSAMK